MEGWGEVILQRVEDPEGGSGDTWGAAKTPPSKGPMGQEGTWETQKRHMGFLPKGMGDPPKGQEGRRDPQRDMGPRGGAQGTPGGSRDLKGGAWGGVLGVPP